MRKKNLRTRRRASLLYPPNTQIANPQLILRMNLVPPNYTNTNPSKKTSLKINQILTPILLLKRTDETHRDG